ncbi:uncharacterized protein DS421_14g466450 [Arachis hypogaea]|nr:uncharacterized protein DS421_14g466450 [Arachis hypogaea]
MIVARTQKRCWVVSVSLAWCCAALLSQWVVACSWPSGSVGGVLDLCSVRVSAKRKASALGFGGRLRGGGTWEERGCRRCGDSRTWVAGSVAGCAEGEIWRRESY